MFKYVLNFQEVLLIFVAKWRQMPSEILVNTYTGNGLLKSPSHYVNQCYVTINELLSHSCQGNMYLNIQYINRQDLFEIYTFEMTAASRRDNKTVQSFHLASF